MERTRRLWIGLALLLTASFAVLLWSGWQISQNAAPMPERVVDQDGRLVYSRAQIERGRQVWQSMGGMQLGSIWGHGAYVAPDWSADWLHREAVAVMELWAGGTPFAQQAPEQRASLQARLQPMMRRNTYDAATGTITLDDDRAAAIADDDQRAETQVLAALDDLRHAADRHHGVLQLEVRRIDLLSRVLHTLLSLRTRARSCAPRRRSRECVRDTGCRRDRTPRG